MVLCLMQAGLEPTTSGFEDGGADCQAPTGPTNTEGYYNYYHKLIVTVVVCSGVFNDVLVPNNEKNVLE